MFWYDSYIGKPWAAVPSPPHSYTCGELGRAVLHEQCGIECPEIIANPLILRECVNAMQPERFGLCPLAEDECPREFDVAFLIRATREDHVGIAAQTPEGLMILHCMQGAGVVMDRPAELLGTGTRKIRWYRHTLMKPIHEPTHLEGTCPA